MLITNGKLITWEKENRILEGYAIYVQGDKIKEIAPQGALKAKYPNAVALDAGGQYVMPGNICAHTHFYGAFARGMGIPGSPPKDFPDVLDKLWWPLDMALDEDAVAYSSLVMLVDAIKHGTTTVIDHHASPNFIDGSLDVIAETIAQSGLRGVLCYEVTDRNGVGGSRSGIAENLRFIKKMAEGKRPKTGHTGALFPSASRLAATFGLHASLTVSDATLETVRGSLPQGVGIHIHVAEHEVDEYDSIGKSGLRVIDRLNNFELLGSNSIVVHAVHIDAKEMAILAETGTWVTYQPRSNMNNGVGLPQVEAMLRMGIPVCIGTDGFSSTMWEEWKTVYLAHKLWNRDPQRMNGTDVVQMGVYNNAALAGQFFSEARLGVLTPGAFADLIFVDYHPYTPMSSGNLPWQIMFGFNESMVTTTIVAGKILMRDRQILVLDEKAIAAEARVLAPKIWERYERYVGTYLNLEKQMDEQKPVVAVLGGTGNEGPGLAMRWANAGYKIIIGSRQQEKAENTAEELNRKLGINTIIGMQNKDAARAADINVLTVVAKAHQVAVAGLRDFLQGKIFVDATARLSFPDLTPPTPPSAAEISHEILGPGVRVVAAFQNVPAHALRNLDEPVPTTVLVCADDKDAAEQVIQLAKDASMNAYYAGKLANAITIEGMTSILINLNKQYKVKDASIKITGI